MHDLSQFQKAALQAMGISLWQTRDNSWPQQEAQSSETDPTADGSAREVIEDERAVSAETAMESLSEPLQRSHVDRQNPLAQKILHAAQGLSIETEKLVWYVDDACEISRFEHRDLITPPLSFLQQNPASKKQLWQLLQQRAEQA